MSKETRVRAFVIGATGYIGGAVARAFLAAGDEVTGLARTQAKADELAALGIAPVRGDLAQLGALTETIREHDAVVFSPLVPFEDEIPAIHTLLSILEHTGKALLYTSGTGVMSIPTPDGEWRQESYSEDDPYVPRHWLMIRVDTENLIRGAVSRGVRGIVVRPPIVWGNNGGFQVPALFDAVDDLGFAPYIGAGLNLYSTVHVDDAARVYQLAAKHAPAGALYHAVSGEAPWRWIAESVARTAGVEARSITMRQAVERWGQLQAELWFGVNSRCRAVRAQRDFGWSPHPDRLDLIADIREGSYAVRGRRGGGIR